MSNSLPPGWGHTGGSQGSAFGGVAPDPWAAAAGRPYPGQIWVYAGFWVRVGAALIDHFILGLFSAVLRFFSAPALSIEWMGHGDARSIDVAWRPDAQDAASSLLLTPHIHGEPLAWALTTLIPLIYFAGLEASPLCGTLGKRALGLRVCDPNGDRIGLPRSVVRTLVKTFISYPFLFIGVIMVAFTRHKQGLHDLVANTIVLREERPTRFTGPA
ncbi:RDD family protein [Acetobacter sacchari]|uniref:RDD family protein n=1 Tax=Acetobacter sacchari TaxID=2661687 RepID=A0ABS3M172_9PROT|nr:RDD family protein [Acetobacter sacchari]MBO1361846.1 RDD family protein [Acetobacter sacchari]